jgi:hypothetical protein
VGATSAIDDVDRFLADEKRLYGAPPEVGPTKFHRKGQQEWSAVWPIEDKLGVVTSGQLRFVIRAGSDQRPTIAVIFKGQCVSRLDFVPIAECEANPPWAEAIGVPASVCGPHWHPWVRNRSHVRDQERWDLPCREPLPVQIRRFDQAFPWLAAQINLVLTPDQRTFELPRSLL